MLSSLQFLKDRIESAKGADRELDADIEKILRGPSDDAPDYTASVDRCLDLLHAILPKWHWHLGRGANGVMPYASLSNGKTTVSANGTTLPQVVLAAIIKALIEQERRQT
ncbi:MAG: hypothetical protein HQ513_06575 [Rhodospirillales bacterium]|nr:hypothetical protein [Rhodospirillales bacterium]